MAEETPVNPGIHESSPKKTETSITTIVEDIADHFSATELTEAEVRVGREQLGRQLPYQEREFYISSLTRIDAVDMVYGHDWQVSQAALKEIEGMMDDPRVPDDIKDRCFDQVQAARESTQRLYDHYKVVREVAIDAIHRYGEGATETSLDNNTGLQVRLAVLREFYRTTFSEWIRNPDYDLQDEELRVLDLNNFKVGNTILGHIGLDELMGKMSQAFIGQSRYASGENRDTAYGTLDPSDELSIEALNSYFPEGTKSRELLDKSKDEGVLVEFYRDKTGGDEAFVKIRYLKGFSEDRKQLADGIVDHVFYESAMPKHEPEMLEQIRDIAIDFPRHKEISRMLQDRNDSARNGYLQELARFGSNLSEYLSNSKVADKIITDPDCLIRMGASYAEGNMDEAMVLFFYGNGGEPGAAHTVEGLLDPKTNEIIPEQVAAYKDKIIRKIELIVKSRGITNKEDIKALVSSAISNDIIGTFIQERTEVMESEKKIQDKKSSIAAAWKGDPEQLYQIASIVREGRLLGELRRNDYVEILEEVEAHYVELFKGELQKPADQRDAALMKFYAQWRLNKQVAIGETHVMSPDYERPPEPLGSLHTLTDQEVSAYLHAKLD